MYLLENTLAVFLVVFRRALPLPADEAARRAGDRDDGMGDDDAGGAAGREVSVFVDGAPTSSAQAQGRKVEWLYKMNHMKGKLVWFLLIYEQL